MKKIITMFLCLLFAVAMLAGCSKSSETFQEKSYTADASQVKTVQIEAQDRKIEVLPSNDTQIRINYYESGKEFYDLFLSDDGVLTMSAKTDKQWTDYIGGKPEPEKRTISLQIPSGLLTALNLSTTNENISLPELALTESVFLSVNNGSISFAQLNAGKEISLNAKNGSISGTVLGGYDDFSIDCSVKKGNSNLPNRKDGGEKALTVSVNNGDAEVHFTSEK